MTKDAVHAAGAAFAWTGTHYRWAPVQNTRLGGASIGRRSGEIAGREPPSLTSVSANDPDNLPIAAPPAPKLDIHDIGARLWETPDALRATSYLKAAQYSIPVLGLVFLKFADIRFTHMGADLGGKNSGRRTIGKADYQARGVLYLPKQSRFANLLHSVNAILGTIEGDAFRKVYEYFLGKFAVAEGAKGESLAGT